MAEYDMSPGLTKDDVIRDLRTQLAEAQASERERAARQLGVFQWCAAAFGADHALSGDYPAVDLYGLQSYSGPDRPTRGR